MFYFEDCFNECSVKLGYGELKSGVYCCSNGFCYGCWFDLVTKLYYCSDIETKVQYDCSDLDTKCTTCHIFTKIGFRFSNIYWRERGEI